MGIASQLSNAFGHGGAVCTNSPAPVRLGEYLINSKLQAAGDWREFMEVISIPY